MRHRKVFDLFDCRGCAQPHFEVSSDLALGPQIIPCLSYCPAGIMMISMRSTRVKQFL